MSRAESSDFAPRLLRTECYDVDESSRPVLKAVRCGCGHIAFPFQIFGCEHCGAFAGLEKVCLPALGTIAACAVVQMPSTDGPNTPFAVAAVRLRSGHVIRTLLAELDAQPGEAVEGVMVSVSEELLEPTVDLRFQRVGRSERAP
jgi:uncharacterized OB-fold protein